MPLSWEIDQSRSDEIGQTQNCEIDLMKLTRSTTMKLTRTQLVKCRVQTLIFPCPENTPWPTKTQACPALSCKLWRAFLPVEHWPSKSFLHSANVEFISLLAWKGISAQFFFREKLCSYVHPYNRESFIWVSKNLYCTDMSFNLSFSLTPAPQFCFKIAMRSYSWRCECLQIPYLFLFSSLGGTLEFYL